MHAGQGLVLFIKEGIHARLMLVCWLLVAVAAWLLQISTTEWITIILSGGLVLSLEAINSALEYAVDLASPQYHALAKKAKDVAAGAVLLASFCAACVGLLIFVPKILSL